MNRYAFFLAGMMVSQSVMAVELVTSRFSVDPYRLYFGVHIKTVDPSGVELTFSLYTEPDCGSLPPNFEQFLFTFNSNGGSVTVNPEVTTIGTPIWDRWFDGLTDHLSLKAGDIDDWEINGSIPNGFDQFQPGDLLCMRIDVPGESHTYSQLPITTAPEASIYFKKSSTAQLVTQVGQVVPYSYRIENTGPIFIHDVALFDDNVDETPVCAFSGYDRLAPRGQPGSIVFCTAQHTVTEHEIEAETGLSNTATVTADELDQVTEILTIPVALFANGFESPPNSITSLDIDADSGSIAIGMDGIPVIAYIDTGRADLKVAKCLDIQCTAASFSVVHGGEQEVRFGSSMKIGNDGFPVISYHDFTDGALLVAKCNDAACSGGDETISLVDDGNVGRYSSLAIGSDGLPIISYYDVANGKLKVASCNDDACSGQDEIITTLNDTESSVGFNNSIAIGADGFPVISYQRMLTPWDGTLKVAKCNDPFCTGGNETVTTLDTTGGPLFESTSLTLGLDGNPVISYIDAGTVTVAKCNDPACTGGNEIFTPIDSSTASSDLSMALGTDGNPVISYMSSVNGSLNVAKCNDPACIGQNESIAIVDSANRTRSSSIAIGVDGLPIVSYCYWGSATGALKVAHCGTLECK